VVAVASGKGGTGKTTVATNLAATAAISGRRVQLLDCDVEAPNAHLFLKPRITRSRPVFVPVPRVDESKCDACGECGKMCRFSAIVLLGTKPLVFPEFCHGCGGCSLVCPTRAITEGKRQIGRLTEGRAGGVLFAAGELHVGEAMSPPLIREVKRRMVPEDLVIVDAPPGTSCPMTEAVRGADFVLLVAEPTPFGLNDLAIAVDAMRAMDLPFAVVVNRAAPGRKNIRAYCEDEDTEILAELPDDRRAAEACSRGELLVEALPDFGEQFRMILEEVERRIVPCVSL
ncbi:MAG: nucleotide-binding protein, partial [Planctomycetota bacterium]